MEKGTKIVFAPDDLGYLVPRGEHVEIEGQLKSQGWHQLETCPKCGSRRLFPLEYPADTLAEVECFEVQRSDLEKADDIWKLTNEALSKIA